MDFNEFILGLVGGHCIGVDPYYLPYKAKIGYSPEIILAGRSMNDSMPKYVSGEIRIMESKEINVKKATSLFWELLLKKTVLISETQRFLR